MFTESFDITRPTWDPQTLAALLRRLHDSGYQDLTVDYHSLLARYLRPRTDLDRLVPAAGEFVDVLIPPGHPSARIILHRPEVTLLRAVLAGRSQQEVRLVGAALKVHLEAVLGREVEVEEHSRALLARFRRDVLPVLQLAGNGEPPRGIRSPVAVQVLRAMRHQPVVRGRPTILASQCAPLAPDRTVEQIREALEQLVGEGWLERWHVVLCREKGVWLGSSASPDEIRAFTGLMMDCPHCGRRISDEQADIAYRLGERTPADNRWLCDLVETALRRLGVEAVAVHPTGGAAVDGAACYHGAVILFRAKDDPADIGDVMRLQEQGRRLAGEGWRVFPLLVADRPLGLDVGGIEVTVVEGMAALDDALEHLLRAAREASLELLLPEALRPAGIPLADFLPAD
ncbi:MAG: hypothetical protein QN141_04760 [Armatimonadota bacterium]|nr:hypothetical protein [Armatimonadota bacterium]MDR7451224.1 hypothetical protein [Armatimonadota bacterium]MDR7466873.1 hypothetical protein [Armatimonadota bacterium]MDR7492654.1 hypothetical protein [Armatimonadota bacterium]MDR7499984.1 hypothetical protein [Armatimonadota bacterium]